MEKSFEAITIILLSENAVDRFVSRLGLQPCAKIMLLLSFLVDLVSWTLWQSTKAMWNRNVWNVPKGSSNKSEANIFPHIWYLGKLRTLWKNHMEQTGRIFYFY